MEIVRTPDGPLPVFDCGAAEQNAFLVTSAQSSQRVGASSTHIALDGDVMLGFVTLAMSSVRLEAHERPAGATVSTLPALLVAQLAVATEHQRKGIAGRLLDFSQGIAQSIRHQAGCCFLAIDCDAALVEYYEGHGFRETKGECRHSKRRDKEAPPGTAAARHRLSRGVLAADWRETDVAPPHVQATTLHQAAESGDTDMIVALLNAGVDPDLPMGRGCDGLGWGAKPLHVAAARGQVQSIDTLLARGAAINSIDGDCETALHWAVRHDRLDAVKALIRHGAYLSMEGGAGVMTPLDYAVHSNCEGITTVLRAAGADHSAGWLATGGR
jgi:predicted N-acetyltransferase YhbS